MTKKVAVVLLNWNGGKLLPRFLPSVVENTPEWAEIILADNHSTDRSVVWAGRFYPGVRILQLDKNYGFAGGYNRAIASLQHPYVLLLNTDIEVSPHWLEPLVSVLEADETVAAVQPKIRSYTNKAFFEYAGAAGGFIDRWGYPLCRGRILDHVEEDHGQYDDACPVFWATGAAMLVRTEIYRELGGLDEDFFAHQEEIDLCWRMKNRGYQIWYQPQSTVYHLGGGTLPMNNPHKLYLNHRNNLLLLYKNLPQKQLRGKLFVRQALDGLSGAVYLVSMQWKSLRAVWRAHWDFRRMKPAAREKRKALEQKRVSTTHPEMLKTSIVWKFFVRKKKTFAAL